MAYDKTYDKLLAGPFERISLGKDGRAVRTVKVFLKVYEGGKGTHTPRLHWEEYFISRDTGEWEMRKKRSNRFPLDAYGVVKENEAEIRQAYKTYIRQKRAPAQS